jgi:hypothetical protein
LMSLHPGIKHLGYSVRPLRGHRKMSKLQGADVPVRANVRGEADFWKKKTRRLIGGSFRGD